MADEIEAGTNADGQDFSAAEDTPISPVEGQGDKSDAAAEAAATSKMNEIFGRNDAKNQADELEEEGITSPDDPDGMGEAKGEDDKETVAEDEVVEEEKPGEEKLTPEQKVEAAARKKTLDAFDPNLKRVAKELGGWKQEDIEDFIASNPTLARVTFGNMQASYNALSLQYAQAARQGFQAPAQQPNQQPVATNAKSALDELLSSPDKLKALGEVAGEELMNGFIKPLLAERQHLNEDRAFIDNLRREAVVREINDSFVDVSKDGFDEYYGEAGQLTKTQHDNRFRVGQVADQIRAGAQLQNVNMTVKEAVRRAHLIVTADQARATARKEIVKQVKTRSKSLTVRPTARRSKVEAPAATGKQGEEAALAAVADFWDERG